MLEAYGFGLGLRLRVGFLIWGIDKSKGKAFGVRIKGKGLGLWLRFTVKH